MEEGFASEDVALFSLMERIEPLETLFEGRSDYRPLFATSRRRCEHALLRALDKWQSCTNALKRKGFGGGERRSGRDQKRASPMGIRIALVHDIQRRETLTSLR